MPFRKAIYTDVPFIVKLLAHDPLGQTRERFADPLPEIYYEAFRRIDTDPHQELIVAEDDNGLIIGTMQLTFIPYLTYQGGIRAQIEAVRISEEVRGQGLGMEMIRHAIGRARERGAHVVQLTTDKKRPDALRFYEKLGFRASHEGMKLHLEPA